VAYSTQPNIPLFEKLHDMGLDAIELNRTGFTTIGVVMRYGHEDLIRFLLTQGMHPKVDQLVTP